MLKPQGVILFVYGITIPTEIVGIRSIWQIP